jgi:hypothetical protein
MSRRVMLDKRIMSSICVIGHLLLRSGSLQACPLASGVRGI